MSGDGSPLLLPENASWKDSAQLRTLMVQLRRFLCIGGTSAAVDLLVYLLLYGSLSSSPAKGISYMAGMLVGFIGNKFWTFESRRKCVTEPASYILLYGVTLIVNIAVNGGVLQLLYSYSVEPRFARIAAFLAATGLTTILNFVGLKFLTFRQATGA
jgi:putative flippase GtrA